MKKLLMKWFGIANLVKQNKELQRRVTKLEDDFDIFAKATGVGIDVHLEERMSPSWAVICVNGKRDYVNFVSLRDKEIREIGNFIRQFEEMGVKRFNIDTPMNMPKAFIRERS